MKYHILLITALIIISGCTSENDILNLVESIPEVKEFLENNPDTTIKTAYWDNTTVSNSLDEIRNLCGKYMEIKPYYRIVMESRNMTLTIWFDYNNERVDCAIMEPTGELNNTIETTMPIKITTSTVKTTVETTTIEAAVNTTETTQTTTTVSTNITTTSINQTSTTTTVNQTNTTTTVNQTSTTVATSTTSSSISTTTIETTTTIEGPIIPGEILESSIDEQAEVDSDVTVNFKVKNNDNVNMRIFYCRVFIKRPDGSITYSTTPLEHAEWWNMDPHLDPGTTANAMNWKFHVYTPGYYGYKVEIYSDPSAMTKLDETPWYENALLVTGEESVPGEILESSIDEQAEVDSDVTVNFKVKNNDNVNMRIFYCRVFIKRPDGSITYSTTPLEHAEWWNMDPHLDPGTTANAMNWKFHVYTPGYYGYKVEIYSDPSAMTKLDETPWYENALLVTE